MAECYNVLATFSLDSCVWNLPMNERHCQRMVAGHGLTQMATPMPLPGSAALFTNEIKLSFNRESDAQCLNFLFKPTTPRNGKDC
jgi:hypothetical protein